jgi:hypothetical protein
MSKFMTAIDRLIDDIQGERAWLNELNDHARQLAHLYSEATAHEVNDALRRLAAIFPGPLVALGHVAIICGSLVERGGDPEIAGPALLDRLPRMNETATDFYQRCRALAESDAEFLERLQAETAADAQDDGDENALMPAAILDAYVASHGWQELTQRFGQALYEDHPASVLGHIGEESFRLGLIAHLSRSKDLRRAARVKPEILDQTLKADEAAGNYRSFLATMLQVLDDEPLLVLHVEERKGFDIRISGIADNFQLHTLLGGTIIGSPAKGLVTGQAPSKRAVEACRDGNGADENATGAFNLWNWTGLQSDRCLPADQTEGSHHWIWNEGCPADIASFEGRRVVLLGPPPYLRHWSPGRIFPGMVGELTVERSLSQTEVEDWLHRLAIKSS